MEYEYKKIHIILYFQGKLKGENKYTSILCIFQIMLFIEMNWSYTYNKLRKQNKNRETKKL